MKAKVGVEINQEGLVSGISGSLEADAQEAGQFMDSISPAFVKEFGGILSDSVKGWRFRNQVRIVIGAKKLIEESGLDTHEVPLKVLEPILDRGSLEEDESLHQMWVNLLANASTSSDVAMVSFVEVLKNLDTLEVCTLDLLYQVWGETNLYNDFAGRDESPIASASDIKKELSGNIQLAVSNLFRLGLLEAPKGKGMQSFVKGSGYGMVLATQEHFQLTPFGVQFIEACRFEEK